MFIVQALFAIITYDHQNIFVVQATETFVLIFSKNRALEGIPFGKAPHSIYFWFDFYK